LVERGVKRQTGRHPDEHVGAQAISGRPIVEFVVAYVLLSLLNIIIIIVLTKIVSIIGEIKVKLKVTEKIVR